MRDRSGGHEGVVVARADSRNARWSTFDEQPHRRSSRRRRSTGSSCVTIVTPPVCPAWRGLEMGRFRRRVAAVVALMAVTAACGGGGDDGGGSTAGTIDENIKADVQKALGGASTTGAAEATTTTAKKPTSIAEWEALWASERAAVVKRIKDNKWGLQADGKTVTG